MIDKSFFRDLIGDPLGISKLDFSKISLILKEARKNFQDENLVLEIELNDPEEEILVIGDIHGNLQSLTKLKSIIEETSPKRVVFLGDLVDRGRYQLECLILVLCLKILDPKRYILLRGNHETLEINQIYDFYQKFVHKFAKFDGFGEIVSVYEVLPVCLIINRKILCLHGGIPLETSVIREMRGLKTKDIDEPLENSIQQIMWNDPKEEIGGFVDSIRGPGRFFFGEAAFNKFMKENKLKYLIRAHEYFPQGYKWFFNKQLLSIFSSANYRGERITSNPASYAIIKNNNITPKTITIS